MKYLDKEEIEKNIQSDIEDMKEYEHVEHFIDAHFQQVLRNGECDDNSLDLSYQYKMIKEIEGDEEFLSKLNFVLDRYVRGATVNKSLFLDMDWTPYSWEDEKSHPPIPDRYLIYRRGCDKMHFERWNGSGWSSSNKDCTDWCKPKKPVKHG